MEQLITILGIICSIIFAYLAFIRTTKQDVRNEGKHQGSIFSDIGYIKACVDRVENSINKVDERYKDVVERLAKVEGKVVALESKVNK